MTEAPTPSNASPGAMLREARMKQGLHIVALAAAIKVTPRKLEALEADRWHELPDATFTRALAQTVCRFLKVDAAPVLALLPAVGAVALEPRGGSLNEPFRRQAARDGGLLTPPAVKPLAIGALLLVVAAAALYWAPGAWRGSDKSPATAPSGVTASGAADAASVPPATTDTASGAVAGETVFSAPPPMPGASAPAVSGALQLRASEATWVEARDARNHLLLSRTVLPGETVGLDGEPPIQLVIGNAAATEVIFRGQPVALATFSRDNVARLELK